MPPGHRRRPSRERLLRASGYCEWFADHTFRSAKSSVTEPKPERPACGAPSKERNSAPSPSGAVRTGCSSAPMRWPLATRRHPQPSDPPAPIYVDTDISGRLIHGVHDRTFGFRVRMGLPWWIQPTRAWIAATMELGAVADIGVPGHPCLRRLRWTAGSWDL